MLSAIPGLRNHSQLYGSNLLRMSSSDWSSSGALYAFRNRCGNRDHFLGIADGERGGEGRVGGGGDNV